MCGRFAPRCAEPQAEHKRRYDARQVSGPESPKTPTPISRQVVGRIHPLVIGFYMHLKFDHPLFTGVFGTADAGTGIRSFLEHGPGRARFGDAGQDD